jgi:hypothetical protein
MRATPPMRPTKSWNSDRLISPGAPGKAPPGARWWKSITDGKGRKAKNIQNPQNIWSLCVNKHLAESSTMSQDQKSWSQIIASSEGPYHGGKWVSESKNETGLIWGKLHWKLQLYRSCLLWILPQSCSFTFGVASGKLLLEAEWMQITSQLSKIPAAGSVKRNDCLNVNP